MPQFEFAYASCAMRSDGGQFAKCQAGEMPAAPSPSSGLPTGAKEADASTDARDTRIHEGDLTGPAPQKPKTRSEFERALRGLGFSKREAKWIAARGFTGAADAEPEDVSEELVALLKRNLAIFTDEGTRT
jgi:hypothetical protein